MPQTTIPQDTSQLDPKVVKVMSAIKHVESGGDYNAVGDSGQSHGAYQWNKDNFKSQATQFGLDPNDFSPSNQNKVAYARIKSLKDQGRQPEEIAAIWNGAKKTPEGTYTYVNPDYGVKFRNALGTVQSKNQTQGYQTSASLPAPTGVPQPEQKQSVIGDIGTDLSKRATEGISAAADIPAALMGKGKQSVVSDVLQTGGAIGGAIGDITNRVLEHTPIVGDALKGIEGLIGQGLGALAKTSVGQSVVKSIQDFSEKHPELAKDVGAGFNIITAIPILRGLGAVKNVALDAAATALKGVAEKGATTDLTAIMSRTVGGRNTLARNPDVVKTLVDERALPDIENGRYTTTEASARLNQAISDIENNELQPALKKASTTQVDSRVPLEQYKQEAVQRAVDELKDPGPVEKYFERLKAKYGDYPTIEQMNEAKRLVAKNISEAGFNSPTYSTDKVVRSILQKSVEDGATALGLGDVAEINQRMARLIKAEDALDYIKDKPVRVGPVGSAVRDIAMAGGEMAGNATGIPFAGAFMGRSGGGFVGKKLAGLRVGLLNRTGKEATRTPLKSATKKAVKGLVSARAQDATKNP